MKKTALAAAFVVLIIVIAIVGGILWSSLAGNDAPAGKLYTYPVSVGDETYLITVRTNWTSAPEVYLPEIALKYVSVDFRGPDRVPVFFNVTVPADLIWGDISVVWKYYEQSPDR